MVSDEMDEAFELRLLNACNMKKNPGKADVGMTFRRNGQRERRRFLSAKLGGCKRGNTERDKRHTMPDNGRKKKRGRANVRIQCGRNRRRKKIPSGRRRKYQEYNVRNMILRKRRKNQPAWKGSRLVFGLAGLTARAEPINRVIERAKWGTENPETLDRFAIPEDRREITHSY